MNADKPFDVGKEATTVSKLADRALNQPADNTQTTTEATASLQNELQSLTSDQLQAVKAEMDRRIEGERIKVKNFGYQVQYEDNPMLHHNMRMLFEKKKEHLQHQPYLNFAENSSGIVGVNVLEEKKEPILVTVLKGLDQSDQNSRAGRKANSSLDTL